MRHNRRRLGKKMSGEKTVTQSNVRLFSPTLMSSRSSFFAYALSAMVEGKYRRRAVNEPKLVFSLMSQYGMFEPRGLYGPVATRYLFQNTPVHAVPHCPQTLVLWLCGLRLVSCGSKSRSSRSRVEGAVIVGEALDRLTKANRLGSFKCN